MVTSQALFQLLVDNDRQVLLGYVVVLNPDVLLPTPV